MSNNVGLNAGKTKKNNDEWYTQYKDIEKEISNYDLKGRVVYCNCDTKDSKFVIYFIDNFEELGLKKLITTGLGQEYAIIYEGKNITYKPLTSDTDILGDTAGDYLSAACLKYLDECDTVITNPPFSIFGKFFGLLIQKKKDFIIMGNLSACTYNNIFPPLKSGLVTAGYNYSSVYFKVPDSERLNRLGNIIWYTTMKKDFPPPLELKYEYSPEKYPKYDTYDAINVDFVEQIPKDYYGVMGVPITFITKHNPEQFELVGMFNNSADKTWNLGSAMINGVKKFKRVAIKRKDLS